MDKGGGNEDAGSEMLASKEDGRRNFQSFEPLGYDGKSGSCKDGQHWLHM